MADLRRSIVTTFAGWTALSAVRSGCPIKSRERVYRLLPLAEFDRPLDAVPGSLTDDAFADWHAAAVERLRSAEPILCVGWAAKLVNVYLKTAAYVGGLGPKELIEFLHPPIDGGLWVGVEKVLADRPAIRARTHGVTRIKEIRTYTQYLDIVAGFRELAHAIGCRLIEVEQFWKAGGPAFETGTAPRPVDAEPADDPVGTEGHSAGRQVQAAPNGHIGTAHPRTNKSNLSGATARPPGGTGG